MYRHPLRNIGIALFLSLTLQPLGANALGLGDHQLNSWLGEPLNMQIDIIDRVDEYDVEQVLIEQVYGEAAAELGFDLESLAPRVKLEVIEIEFDKASGKKVLITSHGNINEPFISILLRVQWPRGNILKNYTLFLDLRPEPAINNNEVGAGSEVSASTRNSKSYSKLGRERSITDQDYRVRSGDTLYGIAQRLRSNSSLTTGELVNAIHVTNPSAFINNDPNKLIAGALLNVGGLENVSALDRSSNVNSQSSDKGSNTAAVEGALSITQNTVPASVISESYKNGNQQGADREEVRRNIASVAETVDLLERENTELKKRLEKLEASDRIQLLEELLALQQNQIASLKSQLGGQSQGSALVNTVKPTEPQSLSEPEPSKESEPLNEQNFSREPDSKTPSVAINQVSPPIWLTVALVLLVITVVVLITLLLKSRQRDNLSQSILGVQDEMPSSNTPMAETPVSTLSQQEKQDEEQDLNRTIAEDALQHLADEDYWGDSDIGVESTALADKESEVDAESNEDIDLSYFRRPENLLDIDSELAKELDPDSFDDLSGLGDGLFAEEIESQVETPDKGSLSLDQELAEIEDMLLRQDIVMASERTGKLLERYPGNKKIEAFVKAWETIFRFDG